MFIKSKVRVQYYIDLGKRKSVASVIYLVVVNNYTAIEANYGRFCSFGCFVQKLRPKMCKISSAIFANGLAILFFGRNFTSPLSITLKEIQQSISLNPIVKLNEQNDEVSAICKRRCMTTYERQKLSKIANQWFSLFQR